MVKKYDYLIVGSGLFGSTFANLANKAGKKVLVIDKREHIAGNIYTENIEGMFINMADIYIIPIIKMCGIMLIRLLNLIDIQIHQ